MVKLHAKQESVLMEFLFRFCNLVRYNIISYWCNQVCSVDMKFMIVSHTLKKYYVQRKDENESHDH